MTADPSRPDHALHPLMEQLVTRRDQLGLTRDQASASSGIPAVTLRSWEQGERTPSLRRFDSLARSYGLRLGFVPADAEPAQPPAPADQIDADAAAHVLWEFKLAGGVRPASFVTQLLVAIGLADEHHRMRLAAAYPGYVAAMRLVHRDGGVARLQAIAERRTAATDREETR